MSSDTSKSRGGKEERGTDDEQSFLRDEFFKRSQREIRRSQGKLNVQESVRNEALGGVRGNGD